MSHMLTEAAHVSGRENGKIKPVVFIADDDLYNIKSLWKLLKGDYRVFSASSGLKFLEMFESIEQVDVIIVNQNMNGLKGADLFRAVNETIKYADNIIKILINAQGEINDPDNYAGIVKIDCSFTYPFTAEDLKKKINTLLAKKSGEKRSSMRIPLPGLNSISADFGIQKKSRIIDISEDGILLERIPCMDQGLEVSFDLALPEGKIFPVSGKIVRTDERKGVAGLAFSLLDDKTRHAIFRYIYEQVTLKDLAGLKKRYTFMPADGMVSFTDRSKIDASINDALKYGINITTLHSHSRTPVHLKILSYEKDSHFLLEGEGIENEFMTSETILLSFYIGYITYNFESMISSIPDAKTIECLYPRVMFYSDKRTADRHGCTDSLMVYITLSHPFNEIITGRVVDYNDRGVSYISEADNKIFLPGTPIELIRIMNGDKVIREDRGEVRHVTSAHGSSNGKYRVGIQFGIGRKNFRSSEAPDYYYTQQKKTAKESARTFKISEFDYAGIARKVPEVIRFKNSRGEEIVGLLNASLPLDGNPVPVVLIPPAYGKTKETLFALALMITAGFAERNKPVCVIRYDGVRRKGEGFKDAYASEPPYEMINSTFSQDAEDIVTAIDWIYNNPEFDPSSVTLVTFSLSALEARIVLREEVHRKKVNYWISCMGAPELRHLLTSINCGLDLVEQYQLGMRMGIMQVLGELINVDKVISDSITNKIVTLDNARADMALIDIPVTWIYGEHDHWVKTEFTREIMGVSTEAPREVICLPTAHNVRTSDEAMKVFATVTSRVYSFLHGESIKPAIPPIEDIIFMRRAERDRIPQKTLGNRKEYWKRYLMGAGQHIGFDILTLSDDYEQLISDQLALLDLRKNDILLDMGGGTGNFIEFMLRKGKQRPGRIILTDLVPEALYTAGAKIRPILKSGEDVIEFNILRCDIELNRYLPVKRFINGEFHSIRELENKIENLQVRVLSKIEDNYNQRLHNILRGSEITPETDRLLKKDFDTEEIRIIKDINAASRYILGLKKEIPEYMKLIFHGDCESNSGLPFKSRSFSKIVMSLVLSYIYNPVETLYELRRIIKPGGILVVSSLLPDADASGFFTKLYKKVEGMKDGSLSDKWDRNLILNSIRSFLNDAQKLDELEEAGTFEFFSKNKLKNMLEESGFIVLDTVETMGSPPQAFFCAAKAGEEYG